MLPDHEMKMWTTLAVEAALLRRARSQVIPLTLPQLEPFSPDAAEYNIWHGKSSRSRGDTMTARRKASAQCEPYLDSGYTRGSAAKQSQFCLYFARGTCLKGHECDNLHHLPTYRDDAQRSILHDIFGREKHRDEREDNGGTGSYMRNCRTLFIHYGGVNFCGRKVHDSVLKAFSKWGPLEDIHVVPSKCIAFVRYEIRSSAEFAKEAMMGQKVTTSSEGVITVRWANDDPNPTAILRVKREREALVHDAILRSARKLRK